MKEDLMKLSEEILEQLILLLQDSKTEYLKDCSEEEVKLFWKFQILIIEEIRLRLGLNPIMLKENEVEKLDFTDYFCLLKEELVLFEYTDSKEYEYYTSKLNEFFDSFDFDIYEFIFSYEFESISGLKENNTLSPIEMEIVEKLQEILSEEISSVKLQKFYFIYCGDFGEILWEELHSPYIPCFLEWLKQEECPFSETYKSSLNKLSYLLMNGEFLPDSFCMEEDGEWKIFNYVFVRNENVPYSYFYVFTLGIFMKIIEWTIKNFPNAKQWKKLKKGYLLPKKETGSR